MNADLLLMFILFFVEISPCSNLLCSPNVNFRPVYQTNYQSEDTHFDSTLEENGFDTKNNNTFQQGNLHLIYFKQQFSENTDDKVIYQSLGRVEYKTDEEVIKNCTVQLENAIADVMDFNSFEELGLIFNEYLCAGTARKDEDEESVLVFDCTKLFNIFKPIQENPTYKSSFTKLWENLNMPDITGTTTSITEAVQTTRQWFTFLTDFRLSCLEGNHRLEFYSRIALGFNINQPAPLQLLENPVEFPQESTVYKCIPAQIYFQNNNTITKEFIDKVRIQSYVIQKQKSLQIKSTWQIVLSTIAEKIMIATDGGEKEESVVDPFFTLITKDAENKNFEKLIEIHKRLLDLTIDVFFEYDPAREELKEIERVFNKQQMKKVLQRKTVNWKGITSHIYTVVSLTISITHNSLYLN